MYAVIFRAKTNELDTEYFEMAKKMRGVALDQYGYLEFTVVTEGSDEKDNQ